MRRFVPLAAAAALFAVQAAAQTTQGTAPQAPAANPAVAAPPATSAPSPSPALKRQAHRISLQQRFDAANVTHDGKLTKDQAAAANWSYVIRNFTAIDKDNKGYVTVDDIRNFARARHAARQKAAPTTPRPAPSSNG